MVGGIVGPGDACHDRNRRRGLRESRALIGIVIVAHGGLAREYLAAVEHVVGRQPGVVAITIQPEDDRGANQGDGVIVVTDMFGGSPSNLSLRACGPTNRRILYGANLPMLIKLAKSRRKTVPDAVAAAMEAGRKYIDSQVVGEDLGRAVGT
jgi:PTS system mannose-specific IIA component